MAFNASPPDKGIFIKTLFGLPLLGRRINCILNTIFLFLLWAATNSWLNQPNKALQHKYYDLSDCYKQTSARWVHDHHHYHYDAQLCELRKWKLGRFFDCRHLISTKRGKEWEKFCHLLGQLMMVNVTEKHRKKIWIWLEIFK